MGPASLRLWVLHPTSGILEQGLGFRVVESSCYNFQSYRKHGAKPGFLLGGSLSVGLYVG